MTPPPRGTFIVIEGLDRAGKTTQYERLAARLQAEGKCIQMMRFPGKSAIEDHVVHLLFSANRWEFAKEIESKIAAGTTIISDRYIHSGMVYSAAKGNPNLSLEWARTPDIGLPKPDIVVFLDLDPEKAKARGGYGEEVYEKEHMQRRVRELYVEIQGDERERIVTVDAGREREEVAASVWSCVKEVIKKVESSNPGPWNDRVERWTDEELIQIPK